MFKNIKGSRVVLVLAVLSTSAFLYLDFTVGTSPVDGFEVSLFVATYFIVDAIERLKSKES